MDGFIDTNGDGFTAAIFTGIANSNLGLFFEQGEAEFLPPLSTNVNCPADQFELPALQAHVVYTKEKSADQLFAELTSGTLCSDPKTRTSTFHATYKFTGGTGRFADATGSFDVDSTSHTFVLDKNGNIFAATNATAEGTLTLP